MRLPNGHRAVVELSKLVDYCLDTTHPRGRHKARVFAARLGFGRNEALLLVETLLAAAATSEAAVAGHVDEWGARYTLDVPLTGPKGTAIVRSGWIIRAGEDFPRFTTLLSTVRHR